MFKNFLGFCNQLIFHWQLTFLYDPGQVDESFYCDEQCTDPAKCTHDKANPAYFTLSPDDELRPVHLCHVFHVVQNELDAFEYRHKMGQSSDIDINLSTILGECTDAQLQKIIELCGSVPPPEHSGFQGEHCQYWVWRAMRGFVESHARLLDTWEATLDGVKEMESSGICS